MTDIQPDKTNENTLILRIGAEELIIRRRYEAASIFNDFLIALWFIVGSVCFLVPSWETVGAWIFLIGSIQFLVRPSIRLARHIHLKRLPTADPDD